MSEKKTQTPRILIMAGGTGGHIFPALAVAEELKNRGFEIFWLGIREGLETAIVAQTTIPMHYISVVGVRGKSWKKLLTAPFRIIWALIQALLFIKRLQPALVVGFGGFIAGPGALASWLLGVPLIIHEQNAIAGTTNRILQRLSTRALCAFPNALKGAVLTGNPVRAALENLPPPHARYVQRSDPIRLLVLGGSRGAKALNLAMPTVMHKLSADVCQIWHQTGALSFQETQNAYQALGLKPKLEPFIEDMAAAYQWADLVICRAGALTVAELAAVGLPSILVPYPYAIDDHQTHNALWLVRAEAAKLLSQETATPENLTSLIEPWLNRPLLSQLAAKAYHLRLAHAAARVAEHCQEVLNARV